MNVSLSSAMVRSLKPIAKAYKCDVRELARVAVEELIAAHRASVVERPAAPTKGRRTYAPKTCECGMQFLPTGPKAKYCPKCRGEEPAPTSVSTRSHDELVSVWDGSRGSLANIRH